MRYAEIPRLYNHLEWYSESRNQIRLNEGIQIKKESSNEIKNLT
ncbi:MAG: hypothetical protein ACPK85_10435 [Methanosarcina sp.]